MHGNDFALGTLGGYAFGVGKHETAEALRKLADRIDDGDALVQQARMTVSVTQDNFTATTLRLVLHERKAASTPPMSGDELVAAISGANP